MLLGLKSVYLLDGVNKKIYWVCVTCVLLCLETTTLDNTIISARINPVLHITVTITIPITITRNKRQTQSLLTGRVCPAGAVHQENEGLQLYYKKSMLEN